MLSPMESDEELRQRNERFGITEEDHQFIQRYKNKNALTEEKSVTEEEKQTEKETQSLSVTDRQPIPPCQGAESSAPLKTPMNPEEKEELRLIKARRKSFERQTKELMDLIKTREIEKQTVQTQKSQPEVEKMAETVPVEKRPGTVLWTAPRSKETHKRETVSIIILVLIVLVISGAGAKIGTWLADNMGEIFFVAVMAAPILLVGAVLLFIVKLIRKVLS